MAETILRTILEASFTAGIAAMIVILLRFPMKKLPKRWSYLMWAVVFFRCLCPFSVESGVSLFNAVNAVPEQSISIQENVPEAAELNEPVQAGYSDTAGTENSPTAGIPENHIYFPDPSDSPYIDHSGNADLSKTNVNPLPAPEAITDEFRTEGNSPAEYYENEIPPESFSAEAEETSEPVSRIGILFPIWAAGTAAMLLYVIISYVRLMRKVKFSVKSEDGVYETDLIPTAFSAGFFPPKIYLPCGLSQKERELIIAHERVHIRRFDFIAKPLAFAGLAIHWFNPLIWAAFILMTRDMELSCDEAVLKILGTEEKKDYSRALLRVSMKRSGLAALPLAFAGTGIKERVKNVLSYKKPRIAATVIAAAIVLTACAVLGTNGVSSKEAGNYDEASLTLIEDDSGEKDQMIEIENSSGDRIILLNSNDRSYHENAGLNAALVENEGQMLIFTGNGIDINIDPEYITRTVITDLQIKHYDDYDGDGETDDLTFVAIDIEFQMTDDYVMPPIGSIVNGDKEHGTMICGGNNHLFSIYAEIEIDRNELEKFPDYCPAIMLTGLRSGIKNDGRYMFGKEIYVTDNLKITDMSLGRTIDEERQQEREKAVPSIEDAAASAEKFDLSGDMEDNTAYILVQPAENIMVYGGYFNSDDAHISPKIIIAHDSSADTFDQEWLTPRSILPRAAYEDFDGDGEKELAVSYYVGSGTGVSVEELVIYKMNESGHFIEHKLDPVPVDMLKENVSITVDNDIRNITYEINGSTAVTEYEAYMDDYFEGGIKAENIYFGSNISYEFTGSAINIYVVPTAMGIYAGPDITAKVNFTGTGFRLTDINFGTAPEEQAELARNREELERLNAEEQRRLAERFPDVLQLLNYPLEGYYAVSKPYNGEAAVGGTPSHKGIDFSVWEGNPVFASADGTVTEASTGWSNGYGNMITIDHGNGLSTLYAHLKGFVAEEGDKVTAGQLIGYSGTSGDTTGNVLHFEVRLDGQYADPTLFLKPNRYNDSGSGNQSSDGTIPGGVVLERFHEMYIHPAATNRFSDDENVIRLDKADPNIVYPVGNISEVNREYTPFDVSADRSIRRTVTFYVPEGTPVYSCTDGIVEAAEATNVGNESVKIGHSYDFSFTYSNISKRLVNVGDRIKKGDLIGYSGNDYTSSSMFYSSYLSVMVKVGGESSDRIYKTFQNADGGSEDFLPMVVYKGMFYIIDEEIKGKAGDPYRFSHKDPIAETQGQKFALELTDELYSNFMPVSSRIYKYEGGAKTYDAAGEPIPPKDDDDLAIVIVYDLNGEHVVIFRPLQNSEGSVPAVRAWFDHWNDSYMVTHNTTLEEFPGVTFHSTGEEISAFTDDGNSKEVLFSGMPIWNAYFCDLTGDGLPEICSTVSIGSGVIDERIVVYDYANRKQYELADRFSYDYVLTVEDGALMVNRTDYGDYKKDTLVSGKLILKDGEPPLAMSPPNVNN